MNDPLLDQSRAIAESILGEIDWAGGGIVRCPGIDLHSKGTNGKRDCRVFLEGDKPPTIYCVHQNGCVAVVAEKNRALRSAIGKAKWQVEHGGGAAAPKRRRLTTAERAKIERQRYLENLRRKAATALPGLVRRWSWPPAAMMEESPVCLGPIGEHWRMLLALFQADDVVWIGDRRDSGKLRHRRFFRRSSEWLRDPFCPTGPLIAASSFQPGAAQRSRDQVATSQYLVVESDTLGLEEIGGVYRFLRDAERLPLHAIIDTAGRSMHAWFRRPADTERLEELLFVLPALGCDPGPLREPCMSRLPGAWRGTRQQRLVYFDRTS